MLDQHRGWFKGLEKKAANFFAVLPFTPNQYTSFSIAAALAMLYFMVNAQYAQALLFFALSAGMDFVDGAVARKKGLSTKKGAYWDTIADRYVEAIFFFGLLFVDMPVLYLPSFVWVFLALFGSTMTTYAKAAAKEKELSDIELKGGLMSRAERSFFLIAILILLGFSGPAVYLLAGMAILCNITAFQRIKSALKK